MWDENLSPVGTTEVQSSLRDSENLVAPAPSAEALGYFQVVPTGLLKQLLRIEANPTWIVVIHIWITPILTRIALIQAWFRAIQAWIASILVNIEAIQTNIGAILINITPILVRITLIQINIGAI